MLNWLAGQKASEGGAAADPDTTGYVEPPETPAPVFAVRAFKHAIFGTPQTVAPKPRRHSVTENARPRSQQPARVERPPMTRPKSAGDAHALGKRDDEPIVPEPVASPTKGILMTPGTAAAKRKTVSFGDGVLDNEEKKPVKTGLPDDCPGKFRSPFVRAGASEDSPEEERADRSGRGKSKLTEQLEQVREESAKRKTRHRRHASLDEEEDVTKDFQEPRSEEARYWKTQYDIYRENSQREMRKLITKQKAAKSFAKDKDFQCTELTDELRQEKQRAAKLERRCNELEAQLQAMQEQVPKGTGAQQKPVTEEIKQEAAVARPELASKRSHRTETARSSRTALREGATRAAQQAATTLAEDIKLSVEEPKPAPKTEETIKREPEPAKTRTKTRPEAIRTNTRDDIWNMSFGSSSVVQQPTIRPHEPLKSPTGRTVTSGTGVTPLKSLNINTLPTATLTRRDSAQPSPPDDRFAQEPLIRQEVLPAPKLEIKRSDSPVLSPGLPQPSPESKHDVRQRPQSPTRKPVPTQQQPSEDLSLPMPPSSPFQHSPVLSPSGFGAEAKKASSYFDRKPVATAKLATSPTAKENAVPSSRPRAVLDENVKPTAAWNAMSAPGAGKRVTSLTAKDGREVTNDRIEAAKARLAAKGRVRS